MLISLGCAFPPLLGCVVLLLALHLSASDLVPLLPCSGMVSGDIPALLH